MSITLAGHNIVITGSGSGLGAAYAKGAAALGASVIVNDIDAAKAASVLAEIEAAGGTAHAMPCDITDPAAAYALIERCIAEFGSITGLLNSAGVHSFNPVWQDTVDNLRRMLEVNVVGTFNCGRAAVGPMMAQGFGSIINVASGAHLGIAAQGSYGASKGAVASLTYNWAVDLAGSGVRVNALSPMGLTPMVAHLSIADQLPTVESNVPAAMYLLSDASQAIHGQMVRTTGTQLSIMAHPAIRAPGAESDAWTVDSVAQAFEEHLAAATVPCGLATYEVSAIT